MTDENGQIKPESRSELFALNQWLADLRICTMFLTRLPVHHAIHGAPVPLSQAVRAFPLVGVIVGCAGSLALIAGLWLGLPGDIAAGLAVLATVIITGGLHEDGLADVADGFGGGSSLERKLDIMRDSRIGSYGVLALVFVVLLKVLALGSLVVGPAGMGSGVAAVIAGAAISRAVMAVMMHKVKPARRDGRSVEAGQPSTQAVWQTLGATVAISGVILWYAYGLWPVLVILAVSVAAYSTMKRITLRQIDGQTGDVLGASQQVTEAVVIVTLAAIVA